MVNKYKVGEAPNLKRIIATDAPLREIPFMPSTLETIDFAVRDWVDNLNIFSDTNEGFKKVPILWVTPERAYQIKSNRDLYDQEQTLIFPLITIERASIIKDPTSKGSAWANIPAVNDSRGGSITIARRIKQDKTSNFANVDARRRRTIGDDAIGSHQTNASRQNKRVVYETITIPMPVYIDVIYSITVRTEYQQQMNEIITPFITLPGAINFVSIKRDGHKFDAFIQKDFAQENNVSALQQVETIYKTKIDLKVLGHLIGEGKNQERPKIVIRENAVDVKFPRERVIYGDIPNEIDKRGFYRE